jgi:putative peptidoglycan lipid II flippase
MTTAEPAPPLLRPTLMVTLFAAALHAANFVIQMLIARLFGAGAAVDAFVAANTLPQYIVTVLIGTLPVVFIPVLTSWAEDSARVAGGVMLIFGSATTLCALAGIALAPQLIRLATPGLPTPTQQLAVKMAAILWPSIIASALVSLVTGLSHVRRQFTWPAAVPVIGTFLNVLLLVILSPRLGIMSAAVAATANLAVQAALILPLAREPLSRIAPRPWAHPGVREVLALLWPLVLSGFLIRAPLVVERYLASNMPPGSIAHVAYASRITILVSFLLSTGIATVTFPRLAENVASASYEMLGANFATAIRSMWVVAAPATAAGILFARPLVETFLQHGQFTAHDTDGVAMLLRVYLLAVAGSIGMITGRTLYALKAMRLLAAVGAIEGLLYVVYTRLLVERIGVIGVAWGFVIYLLASVTWQIAVIRHRIQWRGASATAIALAKTAVAAILAAIAAAALASLVHRGWLQLAIGCAVVPTAYLPALSLINAADARTLRAALRRLV